jgi:hypothetical protein
MGAALGREFGFGTLYIWQPALALSKKPLTPWEQFVQEHHDRELRDGLRACTPTVVSMMAAEPQVRFLDAGSLFDHDSATVFHDPWGHLVERAGIKLAEVIADSLRKMLQTPN